MDVALILKAAIGAILTLAFEWLPKIYGSWQIRRKHFALLGTWKGFHYTFENGKPALIPTNWRISKGLSTAFKAHMEEPGLSYNGKLVFEGDDRLIIYLQSTTHNETMVFRFQNPLNSNKNPVVGLWLSFNLDKVITSGAAMLQNNELEPDLAAKFLKENIVQCKEGFPVMRIKPW